MFSLGSGRVKTRQKGLRPGLTNEQIALIVNPGRRPVNFVTQTLKANVVDSQNYRAE
ncbi:hypothetical protein GCM10027190_49680 [Spirosoma areae]